MRRNLGILMAAAAFSVEAAEREQAPPDVLVYVQADFPQPVVMSLAESIASRMFRDAGQNVVFVSAPPTQVQKASGPVVIHVGLRIARQVEQRAKLAEAFPFDTAGGSVTVFYDAVRAIARKNPNREAKVLAHVLAHEIMHMLQGFEAHSTTGIMKPAWTTKDFGDMFFRPLGFQPIDLRRMHQGLAWRKAARESKEENHIATNAAQGPML